MSVTLTKFRSRLCQNKALIREQYANKHGASTSDKSPEEAKAFIKRVIGGMFQLQVADSELQKRIQRQSQNCKWSTTLWDYAGHSSLDLPLFFLAYAFELGIPAYDSFEEFYMSNDSVFVHQFSGSWLSESMLKHKATQISTANVVLIGLDYQAKQQQPIKSTCSMKHVGCRSCQ